MKLQRTLLLCAAVAGGVLAYGAGNPTRPDPISEIQDSLERLKTVAFRAVNDPVSTYKNSASHAIFSESNCEIVFDTGNGAGFVAGELEYRIPEDGLYRISSTSIYGGDPNNPIYAGDFQYSRMVLLNGVNQPDLDAYADNRNWSAPGVTLHTSDTVPLCEGDLLRFEQIVDAPIGKFLNKRDRVDVLKVGDLPLVEVE